MHVLARPVSVHYHGKYGRVSVSWRWTATGENAIKLGIIASPNDLVKRKRVKL